MKISAEQEAIDFMRDAMRWIPSSRIAQGQQALQRMEKKYGDSPEKLEPIPYPIKMAKNKHGKDVVVWKSRI